MFYRLQEVAGGRIKLLDIAPEVEGVRELVKELTGKVRLSIAHSAADYDIAKDVFELGVTHVTHLYNGMTNYHYRTPGIVGAACDHEKVMVELICDGLRKLVKEMHIPLESVVRCMT